MAAREIAVICTRKKRKEFTAAKFVDLTTHVMTNCCMEFVKQTLDYAPAPLWLPVTHRQPTHHFRDMEGLSKELITGLCHALHLGR